MAFAGCAGYDKLMGEFMGATEFKLKEVQEPLSALSAAVKFTLGDVVCVL